MVKHHYTGMGAFSVILFWDDERDSWGYLYNFEFLLMVFGFH
jgi:hypothetical protein